ncbi:MAG: MBL fold metallo-hydrolase, partial [Flavobacteriales bacterium]|nr:MBL fold metallo-hydrolase [Flavobacteriales bacterium]
HISHFNLEEALETIAKVAPRRAYLTHISHLLGEHEAIEAELPNGVSLGWDGLRISIP